jgi:ATP-dependent RNA helicase RhlE
LRDPVTVTVTPVSSAVDRIDQKLYFVLKAQKTQLMIHLFRALDMERVVVFTKTKHGADRLARKLKAAGIASEAIHGNKAQNQRIRALDAFRSGRSPVLVATDVAARGLDIDDVTHVVNYDLPMEPEAYVHRIGRTARAGKSGHAIAFCDVEERGLLKQVERLIKFEIPRERVPDDVPKSDEVAAKSSGGPSRESHEEARFESREGRDSREGRESRESRESRGPRPDARSERSQRSERTPHAERAPRDRRDDRETRSAQSANPHGHAREASRESSRGTPHAKPAAKPGGKPQGKTSAHPKASAHPHAKPHAKPHSKEHAKEHGHSLERDTRVQRSESTHRSADDRAPSRPSQNGGRRSQWNGRPRGR